MRAYSQSAIVLGASMSGLLAAKALSSHFRRVTVVERDLLPDGAAVRRGVPQSAHALAGGVTTIRRIPLAPQPGQAAEIVGPSIADIDIVSSHGNLVTDGSFLYWQSDTAINKIPVRGEPSPFSIRRLP